MSVSCKSLNPSLYTLHRDSVAYTLHQSVDTLILRDTVYRHDSVIYRERTILDTVYVTKEVYRDRLHSTLNSQHSTLFTISPVRYMGEGAHHGQLNKATLLLATNQICKSTGADYFPSYEIMMDELRDYRFYATDMIHPSEVAVDYIFERFAETYLTDEAIRTAEELRKIKKSLSHRPLHPDS